MPKERELEQKLTPGAKGTTRIKRKKKYVSPFRREAYEPTEIVCVECKLPATKGLPPFIAVNRLMDGEIRKTLRHAHCPEESDGILALVIQQRADRKKDIKRVTGKQPGKVVSLSQRDGKEVRTVIA